MLPGGLEVVGLFVSLSPDAAKGLYPRLRLLLEQLHLASSASQLLEGAESALLKPPHTSSVLLQVCPTSNKYPPCTVLNACACVCAEVQESTENFVSSNPSVFAAHL